MEISAKIPKPEGRKSRALFDLVMTKEKYARLKGED